jgi:hypothetical protein
MKHEQPDRRSQPAPNTAWPPGRVWNKTARKRHWHRLSALWWLACAAPVQAEGVIAILKNPNTVERREAKSGNFLGSIAVNKGVDVGCDGRIIAVLLANGNIHRYDAGNGTFRGSIAPLYKAKSVRVTGGIILVTTEKQLLRYDAGKGTYLGSNPL